MDEIKEILLSIIVPCKNEEDNIVRCLKSVVRAIKNFDSVEIVVVDAASCDKTIEQTMEFPVNIIQLKSEWTCTSSAGRYLGVLNSSGKYIFVVDADMELAPGFLEKAISFMEKDINAAGVAGLGRELYIENNEQVGCCENAYKRNTKEIKEADYLGGAALFRRTAVERAGNFNPYLYSQEELDLCQRLRKIGSKLLSLPYPMIEHYTYPAKGMKLFRKQIRTNRFTGIGQLLRKSLFGEFFLSNTIRFKKFVVSFIVLIVAIIVLPLAIINKDMILLRIGVIIFLFSCLYLAVKKRSLLRAVLSLIKGVFILFSVVKGFLIGPKNCQKYPQDIKVIKKV